MGSSGAERPPKGSPFRVPGSPLAERWNPALAAQRRILPRGARENASIERLQTVIMRITRA